MKKVKCVVAIITLLVMMGCQKEDDISISSTLTFDAQGGSKVEAQIVRNGDKATKPTDPTKEYALFEGWYKEVACTNVWNFDKEVIVQNTTLYAKWKNIDKEALEALMEIASAFDAQKYTNKSWYKVVDKYNSAYNIVEAGITDKDQIFKAYIELDGAMTALQEWSYKATTGIYCSARVLDGYIFVTAGRLIEIHAEGISGNGSKSFNSNVEFGLDELEPLLEVDPKSGEPKLTVNMSLLAFELKSSVASGTIITIPIKSVEIPSISKTIQLKVLTEAEAKNIYLSVVKTLPEPKDITYDDYKVASWAESFLYDLSEESQAAPDILAASEKALACVNVIYNSPIRYFYSFANDVFTISHKERIEPTNTEMTFVSSGTFPTGSYTSPWQRYINEEHNYFQQRISLNADGTCAAEMRFSDDLVEENVTVWNVEKKGTYTFTGDKQNGGMFYYSWAAK